MKRISLGILLLFVAITANAQSKIGTIDAEYILSQMPENTEINKGLETYNNELKQDLQNSINEYEALVKDYQAAGEGLTDEAKKEKENKIIQLENEIKGFRQKASVMIQMKRNELTGPLYDKINAAMQKVIKEKGYTQIFHAGGTALAYSKPEDDITEAVMAIMGIDPKPAQPAAATNK